MFDKLYIELDGCSIKYIIASKTGKKLRIRKAGRLSMEEGSFGSGTVLDRGSFMEGLKRLKSEIKGFGGTASLTVNDGSFITRAIELPIINEKDIEKHLSIDVEQYLPISSRDYEIGFKIIERMSGKDGAGSRVLVSAGPSESIKEILECFDQCGLHPVILEVYPNNIYRLLKASAEKSAAVIDMGKQSINITILKDGSFFMHSNISTGLKSVIDSYEESAATGDLKGCESLCFESFDYELINKDESKINGVLNYGLNEILRQISKYLEYFSSRHFGKTVDRIYITGDIAMLRGLKGIMEESFKTEVSIGLEELPVNVDSKSTDFIKHQTCFYSLIGMAMRGGRP